MTTVYMYGVKNGRHGRNIDLWEKYYVQASSRQEATSLALQLKTKERPQMELLLKYQKEELENSQYPDPSYLGIFNQDFTWHYENVCD